MNKEIKEILEKLKDKNNYISHSMILLSIKETTTLLDCITNLQESEAYYYGQYKDYKSRNEKAVNEIQQLIDDVNNRTIIGLKNFIPKLEEIQDKLAGGDEE